jgi:hypothetical protein
MPSPGNNALSIIRAIHRGPGAGVGFFGKKDGGKFSTIGGCAVRDLERHAPQLENYCDRDFYFAFNSPSVSTKSKPLKNGLQWTQRSNEKVRYINGVAVDLDVGRRGAAGAGAMSAEDAICEVWNLVESGEIPHPSGWAFTGRGALVFWLIHDTQNPEWSLPATPERRAIQKAINQALAERFSHLAADACSVDEARVYRVPRSINSKSGQRVEWEIFPNADGEKFTYSLDYLSRTFGAQVKTRWERRTVKNPGSAPDRANGLIRQHLNYLADIEAISADRGGLKQGSRWFGLRRYAQSLRGAKRPKEEALERIRELAQQCAPAFPSDPQDGTVEQIVSGVYETTRVLTRVSSLVTAFAVTSDEARRLNLRAIVPEEVAAERRAAAEAQGCKARKTAREDAIRAHIEANPSASGSNVQSALTAAGIETSARTIKRELAQLFPNRQKARAGRKPKAQPTGEGRVQERVSLSISKHFGPIKFAPEIEAPLLAPRTDFNHEHQSQPAPALARNRRVFVSSREEPHRSRADIGNEATCRRLDSRE